MHLSVIKTHYSFHFCAKIVSAKPTTLFPFTFNLPGQQRLHLRQRFGIGQIRKHFFQIRIGFEAVGFCGFDQAVYIGVGVRTTLTGREQSVFSADGKRMYRILRRVVA